MKLSAKYLGLVVVGIQLLGTAYADETQVQAPAAGVSVQNQSLSSGLAEHLDLRYWGYYRGGSLSDLTKATTPKVDGSPDESSPQSLESYITTGYKINPELMVGVQNHFMYYPTGPQIGTGQDLKLMDPALTIQKKNLYQAGGFSIKGMMFANLPLTSGDRLQKDHDLLSLSPTAVFNYDLPNSKLSVGFYSYFTAYIPASDNADNARNYKIIGAPMANYQITPTVAATGWVDLVQLTRSKGTPGFLVMENDTADIEPGINWDITKNISFNPFLNIYPGSLRLTSTSIQAVLTAKAF